MRINEEDIVLKDGRTLRLRSPLPTEAAAMLDYLKTVFGETHYMSNYPEEFTLPLEKEESFLQGNNESPNNTMLTLFDGGLVAANAGLYPVGDRIKMRHRAGIGIAVRKEYWGMGLGTLLMEKALALAAELGYQQAELGVYADNPRAIHIYEKLGFERIGQIPNAFRLKDGTLIDEILMAKRL